jgi:hypothetical protein
MTDVRRSKLNFLHVAFHFSSTKNFNSNPQCKGFLGACRTDFYI